MSNYDPNYVPVYAQFLISAKVLLVTNNGEILFLKRSEKSPRAHGWDFPGGGLDKGEDPSEAAVREVLEETGLVISDPTILTTFHGETNGYEDIVIGYSAHVATNEVVLSWEHESYEWLTVEQAKSVDLPPPHKALLNKYLENNFK